MYTRDERDWQPINERVKSAVDVSGAFDNCFFHNYALYLLTNELPLPIDLFDFQSIRDQESKAERLFPFFNGPQSLDLFSVLNPHPDVPSKNLFEKTLVLGFLLREWFPTQLVANLGIKDEMLYGEKGVFNAFKNYKEYRSFMAKEELGTTEFGVLYEANEAFLEYFYHRSTGAIDQSSPFEKYFVGSGSEEEAILKYWDTEGYTLYCKHMAEPQVKLSHIEIMTMMKLINQPITMYDRSTATKVGENIPHHPEFPNFEVAIDAAQGHYFLLKTERTLRDLQEYEASYAQYKIDREAILSHPDTPVSSILVRSTCPKGHIDAEPFDKLIERLSEAVDLTPVASTSSGRIPSTQVPTSSNSSFLLDVGASMATTSSALITLLGIGMYTEQYDPGPSLSEEALTTTVISGVAGLGYGLYRFFTRDNNTTAQTGSDNDLSATDDSSKKRR